MASQPFPSVHAPEKGGQQSNGKNPVFIFFPPQNLFVARQHLRPAPIAPSGEDIETEPPVQYTFTNCSLTNQDLLSCLAKLQWMLIPIIQIAVLPSFF